MELRQASGHYNILSCGDPQDGLVVILGNSGGWYCGSISPLQPLVAKSRTSAEFCVACDDVGEDTGGKLHEYPVFFGIAGLKKYKG